eukprot:6424195-Amphidinium_carterae.1
MPKETAVRQRTTQRHPAEERNFVLCCAVMIEASPRRLTIAAGTVAIDYTVAVPDANSLSMSAAFGTPL